MSSLSPAHVAIATAMLVACLHVPTLAGAADEPATARPPPAATSAPPDVGDEVIVTGKSLAAIRAALVLAEEHMYEVYNSINASDEFDIHCREQRRYHSRILERVCQPNFMHYDDEHLARAALGGMRGELSAGNPQEFAAEEYIKAVALRKDWERLLKDHPELLGAQMKVEALRKAEADAARTHDRKGE